MDPITLRKLLLVKQLYQRALVQSASQHTTLSRLLSVIEFDLAIETVLRAVVCALDSTRSPSDGFQGLVQQCDCLLSESGRDPVPDRANIQHIHTLRNDAQHKTKYPNESDVSDCRTYCRDFLQKMVWRVWEIDFGGIRLADAIQDEEVRQYMSRAEEALDKGDYREAVGLAGAGLRWALIGVETAIVGRVPPSSGNAFILPSDDYGRHGRDVYRAFERMREAVLCTALGLDYGDFMRHRQMAGHIGFYVNGGHYHHGGTETPDASEAEYALAYCIDAVTQIEQRVGDLSAPFGSEHWY